MALTNGELSAADIAAVTGNGNNGNGWGGDGAWWLIVLFLFALSGNWGNRGNSDGGGGGSNGPAYFYGVNPYVGNEIQRGFDQSAIMSALGGIGTSLNVGFSNAEISRCNAQANLLQTLNQMSMAQQECCCENRLGLANLNATVLAENCADRAVISDGIRDIITNQNAVGQRILDQMCNDKIDAKNERIADLERQLTMANLAASQTAQTSRILADNAAQTVALEQYLNPVAVPAYIVQNPNGCGCNNNNGCCGYNNGCCGSF